MRPDATRSGKAGATAFTVTGRGDPVVLVHGVGMDQAFWAPQVADLARDFTVVTLDMLGHGHSDLPAADVTLADYARQVADLLDHLGLPAAGVVGHSMGALVALEFALRWPRRTRRVAAVNAVFQRSPAQREAVMARARSLDGVTVPPVEPTLARWFGDPPPAPLEALAADVGRVLGRVHPLGYARTYRLFATSDAVHAERLPGLRPPALFLTGELDPNSTPAMSEAMARLAPRAQLDVVPGARHMMNLTHPERVTGSLRRFLSDANA